MVCIPNTNSIFKKTIPLESQTQKSYRHVLHYILQMVGNLLAKDTTCSIKRTQWLNLDNPLKTI